VERRRVDHLVVENGRGVGSTASADEAPGGSQGAEALAGLADEYFTGYLDTQPVFATSLGFAGYQRRVADPAARRLAGWSNCARSLPGREPSIDPSSTARRA
jgi:hypothetical protein